MLTPVVEFSREGYKIKKVFGTAGQTLDFITDP